MRKIKIIQVLECQRGMGANVIASVYNVSGNVITCPKAEMSLNESFTMLTAPALWKGREVLAVDSIVDVANLCDFENYLELERKSWLKEKIIESLNPDSKTQSSSFIDDWDKSEEMEYEEVDVQSDEDKKNAFGKTHHGMMSGSSIGMIIIEPASETEISEANKRLDVAIRALAAKGLNVDYCTFEDAVAKRAKGLFEEFEVAKRALTKLENTEFGETAKSYLDEIVSQRRRVFNPERPKSFSGNKHTEWGNGKELEAIAAYETLTGLELKKTGDKQEFIHLGYIESVDFDFSDWFGCTPDSVTVGFFNDSPFCAPIPREFKNPSSGVVFDRYRDLKNPLDLKKENTLYYWQCVSQMTVLSAPYMQWIAYDCDIKSDNPADKFVIIDFERDLAVEQVLINSLFKAIQYIQERI